MATNEKTSSRPTIYDVADHAGVAISTVSRVLNGSRNVSETTRETVLASVRELQFRPNRTAKSLAQRLTRTIAVAVPTFTTPFHNELMKGVRDRLDDEDIDLLLCDLDWEAPKETLLHFLSRGTLDGLLIAGLPMDDKIAEELDMLGAPVILVGSKWPTLDSFYWNEEQGARRATEHLLEQGHERIGMITTPHANRLRNARIRGYRDALDAADLGFDQSLIAHGRTKKHDGFSEESGYEAMMDLLQLNDPVSAVFASSDVQAIGAWQAVRKSGQQVPKDYALVGHDDIKISRFIGLTSVAQSMHNVGMNATDLLLQRIGDSTKEPVSQLVHSELKVRVSCGAKR